MRRKKTNFLDIIPNFGIIISLIIIATLLILSDGDYVERVFHGKSTTGEDNVVETYHVEENEVATSKKTTNSKTDTDTKTSSNGDKNPVDTSNKKEWIQYEKTDYSCKVGEVIDTMIRAGSSSGVASVRSFGSSNTNVATVEVGTSSGLVTNCINCRAVHITCKSEGTASLNAISSNGATTTAKVKVESADKGWIKYDKESYSCNEGDVINAMIRAGGSTVPVSIRSYESTDTSIASVEDGYAGGAQVNCIDCRAVHITCKKAGSVTLKATSSTGATTSSAVTVNGIEKPWVKYDKENYSCEAGQVIDTLITANGAIKSFGSNDVSIADVEDGYQGGAQVKCINCRAVHITCKKKGNVTIHAASYNGAKTTSKVSVSAADKGWIKYDKESYTCKPGEVIDTMIRAGKDNGVVSIKNFSSSNTSIATIEDGSSTGAQVNCINCRAVHVTCKKAGSVTLKATSSTGATTTSSLKVEAAVEKAWVKYDQESYTCEAGQKIDALITANASINGFGSNNSDVADVEDGYISGAQVKCINCRAVHIVCKKKGTATIKASASNGATTTSKVNVNASSEKAWVKYDQESYTCEAGQKIDALITANASINGFGSNNSDVADVEDGYISGAQVKCINCRAVHIVCKKKGTATIKASASNGATTTSKVNVTATDKGWIKYDQESYSCKAGEVIDTMIRAGKDNGVTSIKSYSSSDTNIATIEDGTSTGAQVNCVNCRAVHITCKKEGSVTLKAASSTGATTTSSLKVEAAPVKAWVKYDRESYSCQAGDVIDALITANASINGFGSNNSDIADVEDGYSSGAQVNCVNCRAVHITCKKAGNATIKASASNGATTTSKVSVSAADKGWIKYDQESYTCKPGDVIDTKISAGRDHGVAGIKSFSSSDNSIATVEAGTSTGLYTNCVNCSAVHITCKKAGNVKLKAVSTTGATGEASVKVEASSEKQWIKYDKESYTCKVGEVFDTLITSNAAISNYASSNPSVATIEDGYQGGAQVKCINCRAVHVTCKKEGKVTLSATSAKGAKTTSKVTVNGSTGEDWIKFEKTSYSCKVGQTVDAVIRVGGSSGNYVRNIRSSNSAIASIDLVNGGNVSQCVGCRNVHITCKSAGTMTITATSSTGGSATTTVKVKKN